MQQYRKRPVIVEAVQFTDANRQEWLRLLDSHHTWQTGSGAWRAAIPTLEGVMQVHEGDWLVIGVAREVYPVRDDVFRQTYDAV